MFNFFSFLIAQIYYVNENYQGNIKDGSIDNPYHNINETISHKDVSQTMLKIFFQSNITHNNVLINDYDLILQ